MPKVDWITWKTNIKEIINPQEVLDNLTKKTQEYYSYTNSVIYETINHEMEHGGLTKETLNINGKNLAYEKANVIMNHLEEIKANIEELKKNILDASEEQKQIEKKQLIQAIETKIEEEEKIKQNIISLNNRIQVENELVKKGDVEDLIKISEERITQLQEKLELVKAL